MRRTLLAFTALIAALVPATPAHAGPKSSDRAWVSIGDSFISGEAGRWRGNTNNPFNTTTDRAYAGFGWTGRQYAPERVYVDGTWANGCHRSDVAEIQVAASGAGVSGVNLACSGAETKNLLSAGEDGAETFKGEGSQVDRLAQVARDRNVELVVVSIGGNDLRFSDIIEDCVWASLSLNPWRSCAKDQQPQVDARMDATMSNVRRVLDDVKDAMRTRGYDRDDYRLVLQSYPSPVPRFGDVDFSTFDHNVFYGCPFRPQDLDWARGTLPPQLARNLRAVAAAEDAEFLDVQDLFDGHEVCSRYTVLQNDDDNPDREISWMRWLNSGKVDGDAFKQESFHPNAVGQKALGQCLRTLAARAEGRDWTCLAGRNVDPANVRLTQIKGKPAKPAKQRKDYVELPDHPLDDAPELTQADVDRAGQPTGNASEGEPTKTPSDPNAAPGITPAG
jgi:hypothetical protein